MRLGEVDAQLGLAVADAVQLEAQLFDEGNAIRKRDALAGHSWFSPR